MNTKLDCVEVCRYCKHIDMVGYLRTQRIRRGWSLAEVADRLRVSTGHLSLVERGRRGGSEELLSELAELYDLPIGEVLVAGGRFPEWLTEEIRNQPSLALVAGRDGFRRYAPANHGDALNPRSHTSNDAPLAQQ